MLLLVQHPMLGLQDQVFEALSQDLEYPSLSQLIGSHRLSEDLQAGLEIGRIRLQARKTDPRALSLSHRHLRIGGAHHPPPRHALLRHPRESRPGVTACKETAFRK